ncbi:MAG TPA: single-stranded DNA-binding protein [Candidatus Limnocylindrales bacterium]|jgi:single-strand DNA-binding protein|nr:single-stranded DNA-binding protein [Candidatus Limnocylindrales bacterium]
MNRVLLTGRLTRDPELRTTATGKSVATFSLATHQFVGGKELSEFHSIVTWDRLADTCGKYLGKGQLVAVEGRIATRSWDDDKSVRHWKTEIVASSVEMLSRARRKDHAAETAAAALEAQAVAAGYTPDASEPIADEAGFAVAPGADGDEDEEEDELLEEAVAA